jgi:glutathione S-transferase
MLGDKTFLFGSEPSAADAVAFGMLSSCAARFFDSPLPDLVERHAGLVAYLERMDDRFFRDVTWPSSPDS